MPEYKAVYVVQLLPDAKDADVLVEALFAYAQDRDAGDPLRRRALKLLAHIESKRTDVD